MQLFISDLARWLCTRRFSEPTFRPFRAPESSLALSLLWSSLFSSSLHWPSGFGSVHIVQVWLLNFLRLHCATLHHTTSSRCGWGNHCNHCNHSKKHISNHLSVHQWIRSAIHTSRQLTSPIAYSVLSSKLPPPPCAVYYVDLPWSSWICLMFTICLPSPSELSGTSAGFPGAKNPPQARGAALVNTHSIS